MLPASTDIVGYQTLIKFIERHRIMTRPGDMVEIGTLFGGGARKLSKFIKQSGNGRTLYVIDIFDPNFDLTPNDKGVPMAAFYNFAMREYFKGRSQWDIFTQVTKNCANIVVLKEDSKQVELPTDRLCFGFIDGNHAPDYVESDFHLIWDRLVPGGGVAFHDYQHDLPEVTAKIDELAARHAHEIETHYKGPKALYFMVKKS
jgi:predicted O-methyltransferase YrrM